MNEVGAASHVARVGRRYVALTALRWLPTGVTAGAASAAALAAGSLAGGWLASAAPGGSFGGGRLVDLSLPFLVAALVAP